MTTNAERKHKCKVCSCAYTKTRPMQTVCSPPCALMLARKTTEKAQAKAAAVRMFCSNIGDYETGVDVYDALGESDEPIATVLDRFGALRWAMFEDWDDTLWWEQLELLALDIDAAWGHFEFKAPSI